MLKMCSYAKNCLLLAVIVCFSVPAAAKESSLALTAGYRTDALDWNIAADFSGSTPNILSELTWDDLQSFQVAAEAEILRPLRQKISTVLMGRAAYGWVLSGDNQDSDYAGDNRTLEWSRSNNDAGDGHVMDLEGGAGFRFALDDGHWAITPNLGYAYYEQDLVMQDGYQTLSDPTTAIANGFPVPPPVGPISGLDSSYLAWWYGPWLGVQADYRHSDQIQWDFSLRWHKIDFQAEADWNLRTDLAHPISFEQEADGDGLSLRTGLEYQLREQWQFIADISYMNMETEDGIDIVYIVSPTPAIGGTRLNEVNWESWSVSAGMKYLF